MELQQHLTITAVPNSVILEVAATATNPFVAQSIAQAQAEEVQSLIASLEKPASDDAESPITASLPGKASFSWKTVSTLSNVSKAPLIGEQSSQSERAEAFRVLRTNFQFVDLDGKAQVFVVSSALPDEGKTNTATNFAIMTAQAGRAILLIDCDFRKPQVSELLGLENVVGVLTVLVGKAQLSLATERIDAVGGHIFGAVLNMAPRRSKTGYGYGYGSVIAPPQVGNRKKLYGAKPARGDVSDGARRSSARR